jgi:hypothetical protein
VHRFMVKVHQLMLRNHFPKSWKSKPCGAHLRRALSRARRWVASRQRSPLLLVCTLLCPEVSPPASLGASVLSDAWYVVRELAPMLLRLLAGPNDSCALKLMPLTATGSRVIRIRLPTAEWQRDGRSPLSLPHPPQVSGCDVRHRCVPLGPCP